MTRDMASHTAQRWQIRLLYRAQGRPSSGQAQTRPKGANQFLHVVPCQVAKVVEISEPRHVGSRGWKEPQTR